MIRLMAQQGGFHWRWEAWVGTGLTILVILVPVGILLGQANGYKLSSDLLHVLFWVVIAGAVIGVLLILVGVGAFRWLRHFQSPITFRSVLRGRSTSSGVLMGGRPVEDTAEGRYWGHEVNKLLLINTALEMQLRQWGEDATARKLLKLAMDELPKLSVGFVKDFAGLLYAAHQQPRTNFPVELEAIGNGEQGYISLLAINRNLTLPYNEATMYASQFRRLIEQVQNDSINEAKR